MLITFIASLAGFSALYFWILVRNINLIELKLNLRKTEK